MLPLYNKVALYTYMTDTHTTTNTAEKFGPIRKGLLEFIVLAIISQREVYVANILETLAVTDFATQEGTLYPLLSKIRREGLVEYEWRESEVGPPRKYYTLTARGKEQLTELNTYWEYINKTIKNFKK